MSQDFYDIEFTTIEDFQEKSSYEACRFIGLDFTAVKVSQSKFLDCIFEECNLSNCSLVDTILNGVSFYNCKLLGLHFEYANSFGFSCQFDNCLLKHASFYQMNLQNSSLLNCELEGADFTEIKAVGTSFEGSQFLGAIFEKSDLRKANLSGVQHLSIDPELNSMKEAKIQILQLPGLLAKYGLHILD
jgi:fluoroquinolone resistance protein